MSVELESIFNSLKNSRPDLYEFLAMLGSGSLDEIDIGEVFKEQIEELNSFFDFVLALHSLESNDLIEIDRRQDWLLVSHK